MVKPNTGLTGTTENIVPAGGNFQWALQNQGTGEQVFSITNLDPATALTLTHLQPTLDNAFNDLGDNLLSGPINIPALGTVWADGNFDGLAGIFIQADNASLAPVNCRFRWNSGAATANPSGFLSINGLIGGPPAATALPRYDFCVSIASVAVGSPLGHGINNGGTEQTPNSCDLPGPDAPTGNVRLRVNLIASSLAEGASVQAFKNGSIPIGPAYLIPGGTPSGSFDETSAGIILPSDTVSLVLITNEVVPGNAIAFGASVELS